MLCRYASSVVLLTGMLGVLDGDAEHHVALAAGVLPVSSNGITGNGRLVHDPLKVISRIVAHLGFHARQIHISSWRNQAVVAQEPMLN